MRFSALVPLLLSFCCAPLTAQEESDVPAAESAAPASEPAPETDSEEEDATAEALEGKTTGGDELPPDDSDATAAEALVATLKTNFSALAELLSLVQDEETAQKLLPEVKERFAALLSMDAGALADADEEELAAEFAEAFTPIDAELARLEEAEFFGCEALRTVFTESDEEADADEGNYVFPLGPFNFLRSRKTEERHVCPRPESGLQLMDWSME